MKEELILGKVRSQWIREYPLLEELMNLEEVMWVNDKYKPFEEGRIGIPIDEKDLLDAEERLKRFAPYIEEVFPKTRENKGIIESPIKSIPNMKKELEKIYGQELKGNFMLKCDSHLPISGSIKARGGIYEVLKHAEELAIKNEFLTTKDDYRKLNSEEARNLFSNYSIMVGSTGNLGLSIGIMSAKLGFKVTVHMSADAKQWKKDLLREKGVQVIEYESDYSKAVEEGRKQADADVRCYFIDDENSKDLFLGYAVAASRLKIQLDKMDIKVDEEHPLFVYLPCGVGGGPGGVAFGLKLVYGDNVHCIFAEPTHSPCMLIGIMTGEHEEVCVQDFGIDNITAADGLAVGRPSGFVGKIIEKMLSGEYTVDDNKLYEMLALLADSEGIYIEPSATSSIVGIVSLLTTEEGLSYVRKNGIEGKLLNSTHIAWATGGSMVPEEEMKKYYIIGKGLIR